jgi:hypothetical protein
MSLDFGIRCYHLMLVGLAPIGYCLHNGSETTLSTDPPTRQMAQSYDLPAAIVSDTLENLMGHLATCDAKLKECEAESKRLRDEIAGIMSAANVKSHRSVWGLVTLSESKTYSYSHNVTTLEIQLKAERELERKCNIADVKEVKQVLKVTWAK